MVFIFIISILILTAVIIAAPYIFKEFKKAVSFTPGVENFGRFPFTNEEWQHVYQKEFVEDERGRRLLDKYTNIISYGQNTLENVQREIFFSSKEIYITDGENGKSYALNRLNYFGNGIYLGSIRLLHLSPLKKLQIKVTVDSVNGDLSPVNFDLEYLVPIPQASLENIDEILKAYGIIISDS